jgi:hypothetical protein
VLETDVRVPVVDEARTEGTILTLSHWPKSGIGIFAMLEPPAAEET